MGMISFLSVLMCMGGGSIPKPPPIPPPPPPPSPPAPIANVATQKSTGTKVATSTRRRSSGKSRFRTNSSSAPTGLNIG